MSNLYSLVLTFAIFFNSKCKQTNDSNGIFISVQDMIEASNQQIYGENIHSLDANNKHMIWTMIQSIDAQQLYITVNDDDKYSLYLLSFVLSLTKQSLLLYGDELINTIKKMDSNKFTFDMYKEVIDLVMTMYGRNSMVEQMISGSYEKLMEFLTYTMLKYDRTIIQDLTYLDGFDSDETHCGLNKKLSEKFILLYLYVNVYDLLKTEPNK
eukprot:376997_1